MKIRQANSADFPELSEIWFHANLEAHPYIPKAYWKNHYEEVKNYFFPRSKLFCSVTDQGEITGFIGLIQNYIAGIFIRKEYRGQKIGTQLMSFCQEEFPLLELDVFQKNKCAIHFYEKMGFSITEQKENPEFGEWEYRMRWDRKSAERDSIHFPITK